AASLLKQKRSDFKVLIVGDGAVWQDLQVLAKDLSVEDVVLFTGRVPHHEVERYYSLIDIAPYPRKGLPVCEMVSPMKPFEAMCMEKAIISSDVHALTEIVNDGVTGLLHEKDNVQELAAKLEILLDSPELRRQLGTQARAWVKRERDWRVLSKKFLDLYAAVEKKSFSDGGRMEEHFSFS
ncbi:glycosyltransferase, partial [bacterium]|nr:glycosyltransferase [bacterium]